VSWKVVLSRQAVKDAKKIAASGLKGNPQKLIDILEHNPYEPPYEKLVGNLQGYYSRRITIQHRLVYEVDDQEKTVKLLRMWTHYE
jgi:Txe/YoeB family toxin of toxin-antitoxin system